MFRNCHPLIGSVQTPCSERTWSPGRGQHCKTPAFPPGKKNICEEKIHLSTSENASPSSVKIWVSSSLSMWPVLSTSRACDDQINLPWVELHLECSQKILMGSRQKLLLQDDPFLFSGFQDENDLLFRCETTQDAQTVAMSEALTTWTWQGGTDRGGCSPSARGLPSPRSPTQTTIFLPKPLE